jgi:hypothetical protein
VPAFRGSLGDRELAFKRWSSALDKILEARDELSAILREQAAVPEPTMEEP